MSDLSLLPEALRNHRQLERASCAVSAFECIAKLHGLIEPDTFPLQSDPANQNKEFGDTEFLKFLNLLPSDGLFATQNALAIIERETTEGRFPLISLLVETSSGEKGYHTYLCAQHNAKLLLIDPLKPEIVVDKKEDLENLLEHNRTTNPERKTLHVMTYSMAKGGDTP